MRLHGMRLLGTGESTLLRITPEPSGESTVEGMVTVANPCLSGGEVDIFLEPQLPPALIEVLGDAPIARALHTVGEALGYDVRQADPAAEPPADAEAVLVASHGHDEEDVLRAALRTDIAYIGLIASPRRVRRCSRRWTSPASSECTHPPGSTSARGLPRRSRCRCTRS
ncbi:XdhC family protein [Prauserella oleivorans]